MGSLNTVMVFFILVFLARRLNLKIAAYWYPLLSLFWAFGTVHFYLSMLGAVWFVAQVMGQFFILLCVLLLLINGKTLFTALAGVAFALASYSKNDLMFYIFFIAVLYWLFYLKGAHKSAVIKTAVIFLLPFIIFTGASLWHNAARFDGRIFDMGIAYHRMNQMFVSDFQEYGYLSPVYFPYNFYTEVLQPPPFTPESRFLNLTSTALACCGRRLYLCLVLPRFCF